MVAHQDRAGLSAVTPRPQEAGGGVAGVAPGADVRHRQPVADGHGEPPEVGPHHMDGRVRTSGKTITNIKVHLMTESISDRKEGKIDNKYKTSMTGLTKS